MSLNVHALTCCEENTTTFTTDASIAGIFRPRTSTPKCVNRKEKHSEQPRLGLTQWT